MTYKTILVHVDASAQASSRIALAAQLALQYDAHLVGAALTGVSRYFYQDSGADLARTVLAAYMDNLYRQGEQALGRFRSIAARAGVSSYEARLVDDEAGAGLALSARFADLAVLSQAEPGVSMTQGGDLAAYTLLACPRPLLVVPYTRSAATTGRHVLAAWDGGMQAVRALAAALPFLRRADAVTVASFGTQDLPPAPDPDILPYLKRHGVDASLVSGTAPHDLGDCLLSLAAERGADMLVMGGYGHTRLREVLLGGVTRSVLRSMTIPVVLVH